MDAAYRLRLIYAALGSLGIVGNVLVIVVIVTSSNMRKATTNILIANQSAIDFSASLFIVLTSFIRDVNKASGVIGKELFCRLWANNMPLWGLFVSSTFNLVCITMERYSGIVHPIGESRTFWRRRVSLVMAFTWISGLAYNVAYMAPTSRYKEGQCTAFTEWPSPFIQRAVGLLTICIQFFLPIVVIGFAYVRIVFRLRHGHGALRAIDGRKSVQLAVDVRRERGMRRARLNVVKTLVMVSLSFLLCWSPNQIYYTMYNLGFEVSFNHTFYHFTVIAVFLNCCINPFIYAFQYDQFKNEMLKLCRRSPEVTDVLTSSSSEEQRDRKSVYVIQSSGSVAECSGGGLDNEAFDQQTDL